MTWRSFLFAVPAACAIAWPAHAVLRTAPEMQPAAAAAVTVASRRIAAPAMVRLAEPLPGEATAPDGDRSRVQIGFARNVQALRTAADVARHLAWIGADAQRQAAALAITSPGASALRVALRMGAVPRGTRFRFAGATGPVVEVDAADVEAAVARNVYYGEDSPAAHLFWSPVLEGDTAIVEVEMPANADVADLHVAIPQVSHLVASAAQGFAGACAAAACDGDAGPTDGQAGARIVFTEDGATYACNGMLVADRDPETVIPFFLTSRHCIATQSAASTAQPYWPHDGVACAAAVALDAGSAGATLLHADASTDLTLLRLQHAPPVGAVYAGWMVGAHASAQAQPVAASLGQCSPASGASARFEAAYDGGLYQWLGGTPQDAAEEAVVSAAGS